MNEAALLDEIVRRLLSVHPRARVLLFGSRARGDARADSDYDLLVVTPDLPTEASRSTRARLALRGLGVAFDLVMMTPAEFASLQQSRAWHARELRRTARTLHDAA